MTPPLDLAALRALLANATPLPWQDDGSTVAQDSNPWADVIPTEVECSMFCYGGSVKRARKEDISLIVAAVNALPALLDRLERAERVVDAAQKLAASVDDFAWSSDRMDECRLYPDGKRIYDRLDGLFAALTPTPEHNNG